MTGKYRLFVLSIIISCLAVRSVTAGDVDSIPYADHLFKKGEYYRAISEYERYLFHHVRTREDSNFCHLQIAKSYYFGGDYENAIYYVDRLRMNPDIDAPSLNKYAGLSYLKRGYPKLATTYFERCTEDKDRALLIGISFIYQHEWEKAYKHFMLLGQSADTALSFHARSLALISKEGTHVERKNPLLAGFLGLVPGAGYIYTGMYQTAVSSFVVNSLLLGSSYELYREDLVFPASTVLLVAVGFYVGNMYGSVNAAVKYNNKKQREYIDDSLSQYRFILE